MCVCHMNKRLLTYLLTYGALVGGSFASKPKLQIRHTQLVVKTVENYNTLLFLLISGFALCIS